MGYVVAHIPKLVPANPSITKEVIMICGPLLRWLVDEGGRELDTVENRVIRGLVRILGSLEAFLVQLDCILEDDEESLRIRCILT